ncbi:GNAT family N-acetyltransferase [uncultured Streptomyces sp.]|uniref:GNAT family N-acetyltransferase n=1 Tax=uncultured Streptomyces sp. TaxID=174707 RepID=UPI00261E5427|nr:GNAT family protein [uncultured Streptomyces sp.]
MIDASHPLTADTALRPAVLTDAPELAAALLRSRAHMAPREPARPQDFYTPQGQAERISGLLADRAGGRCMPWVLVDAEDRAIGSFTLSGIVLGPFRSGVLGYWVDARHNGRGLATAAVARICELARDELGLHRVEAGTMLDNVASQRVLLKCGFEEYGMAPRMLHIAGEWRDHRLFQRILHDGPPRA